ncbi:MAG TPA: indole-3-glycerol-phosphate synthase [Acidimicrobiales bacterium]|nr:indole-3-glycerol-phosphate synthase [Acidimicrobiales bacterium]
MTGPLDEIVAFHRARAAGDERPTARLLARAGRAPSPPSLLDALVRPDGEPLRVIAEVKRRSPSAGELRADLDAGALATAYDEGGAAAISVLTDGPHFGGSPSDVATVLEASDLPVLRKDFTMSANDVADARLMGASGVLLIVAILARREVRALLEVAGLLGLTALVEVHDAAEQELALGLGALVVGVNQRDLSTFEVDPARAAALAGGFPSDVVTVAESGLADAAAARRCGALGYDAVLVGEALVRSGDPAGAIAAMRAVDDAGVAA